MKFTFGTISVVCPRQNIPKQYYKKIIVEFILRRKKELQATAEG